VSSVNNEKTDINRPPLNRLGHKIEFKYLAKYGYSESHKIVESFREVLYYVLAVHMNLLECCSGHLQYWRGLKKSSITSISIISQMCSHLNR
jgi:hypothetical protein